MSDSLDPTPYEQPAADPAPCDCVEIAAEPVVSQPVDEVVVDPVETYAAPVTPEPVVQSAPVGDASPPLPEPVVQTTVVGDAWTPAEPEPESVVQTTVVGDAWTPPEPEPEPAVQTMVVGNAWSPDPSPIDVASPAPAPQVFEVGGPAWASSPPAEPVETTITPWSPFNSEVTESSGPSAPADGAPTVIVIGNGTDGNSFTPSQPDDMWGDLRSWGLGIGVGNTGNAAIDGIVGHVGVQANRNVLSTPTPNDIIVDS